MSDFCFGFRGGISFYNTGDTAYSENLLRLLPSGVDICAICINGGYHNLSPQEAATVVKSLRPQIVIPCHYDYDGQHVSGRPEMFRVALGQSPFGRRVHLAEVLRTLGIPKSLSRVFVRQLKLKKN